MLLCLNNSKNIKNNKVKLSFGFYIKRTMLTTVQKKQIL